MAIRTTKTTSIELKAGDKFSAHLGGDDYAEVRIVSIDLKAVHYEVEGTPRWADTPYFLDCYDKDFGGLSTFETVVI